VNTQLPQDEELQSLLTLLVDGEITAPQFARLRDLMAQDPAAAAFYRQYMRLCALLEFECAAAGTDRSAPRSRPVFAPVVAAAPATFFSTVSASLLTPGGFLFSYVVAAVLLGIATLVGAMYRVPSPSRQMAVTPAPIREESWPTPMPEKEIVTVARVTDMVDVTWADTTLAPSMQRILLGDKFALASGLMEITYDTGATVVLQGPCTYTVESKTGGYLARGRLMARVEKKGRGGEGETGRLADRGATANSISQVPNPKPRSNKSPSLPLSPSPPLFSVRTPTAVVTDLGTEFGVEVDENNGSGVYVFVGAVDFTPAGKTSRGVRIAGGEAGRISAGKGGAVEKIVLDRDGFAKPRAMLARKSKQDEILFHDTFETFALGKRWRPAREKAPERVLEAVTDGGRTALRMKARCPKNIPIGKGIETVEAFPLCDLESIEADVVFRCGTVTPPSFQVWLYGASTKMVRMQVDLEKDSGRILLDSNLVDRRNKYTHLDTQHSPDGVYRHGQRYRCVLSVDGRGAHLTLKDDVNGASVYQARFDDFPLAGFGESVRVVLRMVIGPKQNSECWVYDVTVRGRFRDGRRTTPPSVSPSASKPQPAEPLAVSDLESKKRRQRNGQ
jgi:hypothetical protein